MKKFKMFEDEFYGAVILPSDIFDNLKEEFFISRCTDDIKYMCANQPEEEYLIGLGIDMEDCEFCDWFKLIKQK